jgi:hypothetical protein
VSNTTGRRYPLSKLLDACDCTEAELVRRLSLKGVHFDGTTLKRAREQGLVERAADRYAARLGWVVWHVWPEWLDDIIADESKACADTSCGEPFVPNRGNQIYCSAKCARRVTARNYARRKWASDPEWAEKKRVQSRARKAASRRARLIKQRAYYQANRERLLAARRARHAENREADNAWQRAYRSKKETAA